MIYFDNIAITNLIMFPQIDNIIQECQRGQLLSPFQLQTMVTTLAISFKKLTSMLSSSGALNIQNNGNQKKVNPSPQNNFGNNPHFGNQHGQINHSLFNEIGQQLFRPQIDPKTNPQNEQRLVPQHESISKKGNQSISKLSPPIFLTYINRIPQWWPPEGIARGLGVPDFAPSSIYNCIVFTFWTNGGPVDIVKLWSDPTHFMGTDSVFGKTKEQIQTNIKKRFNDRGIRLMISAFGGTQFPTTGNVDPLDCASKLGKFVLQNNLDGVDIDWQDNSAMESGKGQQWLIKFQLRLRQILPNHIISHAPQAPYFKEQYYKNGAYVKINRQVGHTIDFYNVQFYNQGDTKYDSYQKLFLKSGSFFSGTSVSQIASRGVPLQKIIVGKPVKTEDAANTGWVDHTELGNWVMKANSQGNWFAGIMYWQYISDGDGKIIRQSGEALKNKYGTSKK